MLGVFIFGETHVGGLQIRKGPAKETTRRTQDYQDTTLAVSIVEPNDGQFVDQWSHRWIISLGMSQTKNRKCSNQRKPQMSSRLTNIKSMVIRQWWPATLTCDCLIYRGNSPTS